MAVKIPKQLETIGAWAKAHSLAFAFSAIVILVPIGGYFAADMMGEGVRKEAQRRAAVYNDLGSASAKNVDLPLPGGEPVTLDTVATEKVVEQFGAVLEKYSKDASEVYAKAHAFHQGSDTDPKHKPVVQSSVFPRYDAKSSAIAEQVRFKVADAIAAAYTKLLEDSRAGSPPSDAAVTKNIDARELRYIQGDLKQESRAKLSAEQSKQLDTYLGKIRIAEYAEAAKKISIYADLSAFDVPSRTSVTGLYKKPADGAAQDAALFDMQWKLWIASDVMQAFNASNRAAGSVLQSPVKRLVSLSVQPRETAAVASSGEATSMGGEAPPADAESGDGAAAAPVAPSAEVALVDPVIDTKQQANRDFTKRFTGRVTNGVYDVRLADVSFIAETSKLPLVFDALSAQNFMTVTNVRLAPADPFIAARAGFLFGPESVSQVTATIETIWFRDWTSKHMPASVRTALGIVPTAGTGADVDPAAGAASGM